MARVDHSRIDTSLLHHPWIFALGAGAATGLRTPTAVGAAILATACLFLTLRGLDPVDAVRVAYFLPRTSVYAVAFEVLWRRPRGVVRSAVPPSAAVSDPRRG